MVLLRANSEFLTPVGILTNNPRMGTIEHLTSAKKIMDIYFLNSSYTPGDELCWYFHRSVILWYLLPLHSDLFIGRGKGQSQGWADFYGYRQVLARGSRIPKLSSQKPHSESQNHPKEQELRQFIQHLKVVPICPEQNN